MQMYVPDWPQQLPNGLLIHSVRSFDCCIVAAPELREAQLTARRVCSEISNSTLHSRLSPLNCLASDGTYLISGIM